jgi:hypothetical protein
MYINIAIDLNIHTVNNENIDKEYNMKYSIYFLQRGLTIHYYI